MASRTIRIALLVLLAGVPRGFGAEFDVCGTVQDADEQPMAGATVWLVGPDSARATETDADGRFAFTEEPSGKVSVVAYREGLALGGTDLMLLDDAAVEIVLAPAIETPLRTVDPRLRPIAGARLLRMRVNDVFDVPAARLSEMGLPSVRSDRAGRFVIPFLAKGDYARIEIDHRRFAREVLPTLPAGTAIDAVLPFGEPVRGRVLTPEGKPAEGAEVRVFRSVGRRAMGVDDGTTGPDGFYTVVVPPGEYYVTARLGTYGMPAPVSVAVEYEQDAVAPDLTLKPTTLVSGATLDEDGAPVPGVHVRYVQDRMVLATAVTDSTGRYRLYAHLGEGTLRFTPPKDRAILDESEIELSLSEARPLALPAIRVAELPVIEGTVSAEGIERLDDILVSTTNLQVNVYARPDADGRFAIALKEFPHEGRLALRAEHAYRFLRGEAAFHVFDDPAPRIVLEPFQPNLAPAREGYPNNLRARVGKPAPELAAEHWVNAEAPVALADLRGKVVVLTLWASFDTSAAARSRMREVQRWHEVYGEDVAFVGVHEGTLPADQLEAAVDQWGITFPVGRDTETFETFDRYSTNFVPQTVLIDKEGVVRHYDVEGRLGELIKDLRRR